MKTFLHTLLAITAVAAATFGVCESTALAANQSEGTIPQSGDRCGGSEGNGQIISLDNNSFTLKLRNGKDQIIRLTGQATIKISTGRVSLSDLKIGDRVTIVGGPNRDGGFTADTVVVCSGTPNNESQATRLTVSKENTNFMKVSTVLSIGTIVLFGLAWFSIVAFLVWKKKKNLVYVRLFTTFYVYLYKVLDYTLIQFRSLLLLKHFVPTMPALFRKMIYETIADTMVSPCLNALILCLVNSFTFRE